MTQPFTVRLFHGLLDSGRRHSLAVVRDPTGHDELMLAELGTLATPAEQASSLIAALTVRVGDIDAPARELLLKLTAGDRERLVLAICARVHGPDIDLVVACPSCGTLAEIPVRFEDVVAVPSNFPPMDEQRFDFEAEDGHWTGLCRPPMGADLEKAARGGPEAARGLMLDCLLELANPAGLRVPAGDMVQACTSRLSEVLADFDPVADCTVEIDCPSCSAKVSGLLDGLTILRSALGGNPRVYDDVYRMARAYHWSEAEILSLPLRRRRLYLTIAGGAETHR